MEQASFKRTLARAAKHVAKYNMLATPDKILGTNA